MNANEVKKLSVENRFLYWIKERESIRIKKERGDPKPWTDDEILQSYRFCNVRRMDDKVSKWLLENWYEPNFDHKNMLLACGIARVFNNPECLAELGFPTRWNKERVIAKLQQRKATGSKLFNAAYIVSTNGLKGAKEFIVVNRVLQPLSKQQVAQTTSLEALACSLTRLWGISTFMAGQVSADVRWAIRGSWQDKHKWAFIGPGSRRGMNRLLGKQPTAGLTQKQFEPLLLEVIELVKTKTKVGTRLEAIDVQNCLCEFDKYERTLFENRKPKQKYEGVYLA